MKSLILSIGLSLTGLSLVANSGTTEAETTTSSSVSVDLHFNQKHLVGNVDGFQREKFVQIHSANYENLKAGGDDLMDYLLEDLNVFYGRETGNLTNIASFYNAGNAQSASELFKDRYKFNTRAHGLEQYQPLLSVSGQYVVYNTFLNGASGDPALAGTNYGDLLNIYIDNACGTGGVNGMPRPAFFEVLNEPLWHPIDQYVLWKTTDPNRPTVAEEIQILDDLFVFHREAARELHRVNPDAKIGGFAEAFPDPESRNFFNWEHRWKKFIDMCGADMDFYSFHTYDFNEPTTKFRKGGNLEALMDLLSHYNNITWGEEKPFLITEFGARTRHIETNFSNPYRDWLCSSSICSMMMQYMDRPDMVEGVTPFIMAVWSLTWSIFNPENVQAELTDYAKMYELWSDVKGVRLFTETSELDLQVDAYTFGDKTYLILNNLENTSVSIDINELGIDESDIISTTTKQLHWVTNEVRLDEVNYSGTPTTLTVSPIATMVVEYTATNPTNIQNTFVETRNYATTYKQDIVANTAVDFNINGLELTQDGVATLRLGLGRSHGRSLQPVVRVNNTTVSVSSDWRGDAQSNKASFFGILEIDVPYNLLQEDNVVSVEFPDTDGFVTSVVMRVFSKEDGNVLSNNTIEAISSELSIYPNPTNDQLFVSIPQTDNKSEYVIYDSKGQVVNAGVIDGNAINVNNLSTGVYFIKIASDDDVYFERFIKED